MPLELPLVYLGNRRELHLPMRLNNLFFPRGLPTKRRACRAQSAGGDERGCDIMRRPRPLPLSFGFRARKGAPLNGGADGPDHQQNIMSTATDPGHSTCGRLVEGTRNALVGWWRCVTGRLPGSSGDVDAVDCRSFPSLLF